MRQFSGSRQGIALLMARTQPKAAEAMGITRNWARVSVFTLSAALAALAGAIMAFCSSTVSPNSFSFWSGVFLLVGAVVSLTSVTLPAALAGGLFITLAPTYLSEAGDWVPILYGVALVAVTLAANSNWFARWMRGRLRR
jgi:branched-chain amino acid transport system permease protein